jgi:hypothetical protein
VRQHDSYHLEVIDQRTRQIEELSVWIEVVMEPFQSFCALIHTITGIGVECGSHALVPGRLGGRCRRSCAR